MDNFRRPKKPIGSIDGFVSHRRVVGKPMGRQPGHSLFKHPHAPQQSLGPSHGRSRDHGTSARPARIDDFGGPEGFRPNRQPHLGQPGGHPVTAEIDYMGEHRGASRHASAHAATGGLPHLGRAPAATVAMPEGTHIGIHGSHGGTKQAKRRGILRRKVKDTEHKKRSKLKLTLKLASATMMLAMLVGGGLVLKGYLKTKSVFKGGGAAAVLTADVDPTKLKGEGDGRVNILLLGRGGPGHDGPDLTDTLLIASIDPINKDTALLSVPRDMWVKRNGAQSKINAVYANAKMSALAKYPTKQRESGEAKDAADTAGVKAIEETMTEVLGIPMHYYVMVDFEAFRKAIDTVGGIDITVKTRLYDPTVAWENKRNPLIADVGPNHFDGKKALLYARSRHGSARGDFDRAERQREVILAMKEKVLKAGTFANPVKINSLIDAFGDHVSSDFSINEIMRIYDITKDISGDKVQSVGLADPPNDFVTTDSINSQSVVRPKAGLFVYSAIQNYVRNVLKDGFIRKEDAKIVILNGTNTPGLATKKSEDLKSYGYNITQVADAPTKGYTKTAFIDLTNGAKKYTKNYLEKRLGVTADTSLPDPSINAAGADFVIILGSNETTSSQN